MFKMCPQCLKNSLQEEHIMLTSYPGKYKKYNACFWCGYREEVTPVTARQADTGGITWESEAEKLMREHLRDYHGVK